MLIAAQEKDVLLRKRVIARVLAAHCQPHLLGTQDTSVFTRQCNYAKGEIGIEI